MINNELRKYIESNILPRYNNNDKGHGIDHIIYVINRSLKFASKINNINLNMVYVIAAYHDIGHSIDAKKHEIISSEILLEDAELKKYFNNEEINIMSEAIRDHRASLEYEPRSIYGKIVSSADRNTDINSVLKRTYEYRKKHSINMTIDEIINESYNHILNKFGTNGYAKEKIYFKDEEYENYLKEINQLLENYDIFKKIYIKVNNIDERGK